MKTKERAEHLARVAKVFPLLGRVAAEDLLTQVRLELGHGEILDGFAPYGAMESTAIPRSPLLHVVSGNTPHAALQTVIRGLLLGAQNRVKVPRGGLPELAHFHSLLPSGLQECLEISEELPDAWVNEAQALIVFGSDETIAHFRERAGSREFQAHGHKISLGVIFHDEDFSSVSHVVRDVALFDQQGCLSAQVVYVGDVPGGGRVYAEKLAAAMERFEKENPRGPVSLEESAKILQAREDYLFRAASQDGIRLFVSPQSDAWTVVFTESPEFPHAVLNRFIFVKPLPEDAELEKIRPWIGTVGIWPASAENAHRVFQWGGSRICLVGQMQFPHILWHQDGGANLASLVHWVDFEKNPA